MKGIVALGLVGLATAASAQYAANGISASSPLFTGWATGFKDLVRGPVNITNPGGALASFGTGAAALGAPGASTDVVSLGDGGKITLNFANPIGNGTGADFAVFENGFVIAGGGSLVFAELGFVEVSSNGTDFFRFPSVSLTQTATQTGAFAGTDPTKIHNLAGQFVSGEGTPFDLSDLIGISPLLDVNRVTDVRIVDVVGTINPTFATHDSLGNIINDPYATAFASGGFDLDAVGVINAASAPVPEPATLLSLGLGAVALYRRRKKD